MLSTSTEMVINEFRKIVNYNNIQAAQTIPIDAIDRVMFQDASDIVVKWLVQNGAPAEIIELFQFVLFGGAYEIAFFRGGSVPPDDFAGEGVPDRLMDCMRLMDFLGYRFN